MVREGIGRRAFLVGAGAGAGLLLARGLGVRGGAGLPHASSPGEALRGLVASLTPGQRRIILLPWDHPSRQVTNTISILDRPHLGTLLSPHQQRLARRLCDAMLSERGRVDLAGTFAVEGRFEGCTLSVYGDPEQGRSQASIMGGHVHVRGGVGASPEPLGGAVAYGHQIGNERWRVEGNSFAYHGDAANRLWAALDAAARRRALLETPPHELVLQPRAAGTTLPGVRVDSLDEPAREEAQRLLDTVLGVHPDGERADARAAIDANGGTGALHFATFANKGFYADMRSWGELDPAERAQRGDPYWQVWRLEGPGTVIHFQGHPHVHAYVNVVRDPRSANVGDSLGTTPGVEGESMRRLLEAALRRASGERLAWHHQDVPGRFCPGGVTTGLAWAMDPYGNRVVVATLPGKAMAAPLRTRLKASGEPIEPDRRYRVATLEWYATLGDAFGEPESVEDTNVYLRDALVEHLRAGGLRAA